MLSKEELKENTIQFMKEHGFEQSRIDFVLSENGYYLAGLPESAEYWKDKVQDISGKMSFVTWATTD